MNKVLVIGGGIGGLTAAVALRRKGIEAHVYETAPALQPVGKGIWVPVNAMQVLQRLGLSEQVRQAGWPLECIQIRTSNGGVLMEVDLRKFQATYGHLTISIHRAALVQTLAAALPEDAVHLGKRLVSLAQDEAGVSALFEDGSEARGDVLLGADGIRSAVRETIFPGVQFRYSGQTCYRGVAQMDLPPSLARTCWEVWGADGTTRMGFSAIGPGQVYWFAPLTAPAGLPAPAPQALSEELTARYAHFPAPIPDIVRLTPAADILKTDLFDFPSIGRWCQGRVALLGDAAHAMTPNLGQGGAQAIEDGYVLAERLQACATVEQAFREYEKLRMPKAHWIAKSAWRFGQLAHVRSRPLQWLRNWTLRLTPGWANDMQIDLLARLNY